MSAYETKGKYAIVTGAGSGICHAFTKLLLEAGCSVILADIALRPEAKALVAQWTSDNGKPTAYYHKTDMSDWGQIASLWETALHKFGRVDIVVNGAGIYEPPSSTFWNVPTGSALAEDDPSTSPGVYKTFSINTMGPIRLAQYAVDYWMQNRIAGNLLWVASMGAYLHSLQTPLYAASKAALVSFVKSLANLRKRLGIRNAAICPGPTYTPVLLQEYCRDRIRPDDFTMTPEQCAGVMMSVLTQPQYGDGNIVEAMLIGTRQNPSINVREVPMEALYPTAGPIGADNHLFEEEERFTRSLEENGMPK